MEKLKFFFLILFTILVNNLSSKVTIITEIARPPSICKIDSDCHYGGFNGRCTSNKCDYRKECKVNSDCDVYSARGTCKSGFCDYHD